MDELFLLESNIQPWLDVPLWVPSFDKTMRGFTRMDTRKAERYGLVLRPIADTLRDVFDWDNGRENSPETCFENLKAGLSGDRHSNLLKTWADKGISIDPGRAIAPAPPDPEPTQSQMEAWLIEGDD